ncbi:MAG TPA: FecR domain-containing protein [Kofleriaceae bacterium]|nr:FecR domain-containing protein [Kofleriaceae bacterium]
MTCPGDAELARALAAGGDPEIAAHLEACAICRAVWDATRATIELARELPIALPPPARREEVRTAVLAAAQGLAHRPARRAWRVPAIAAAAAAVAGTLALARSPAPGLAHHAHGTVHPRPGARWTARSAGPDEIVELGDGAIDVEVEPLHPGERFRVIVGDAELEVRGTAFTAIARAERLIEVAVAHGRVDLVHAPGALPGTALGAPATLTAGQWWHAAADAVAAAPVSAQAPPVVPAARESVEQPPAPAPPRAPAAPPQRPHRATAAARRELAPEPAPPAAAPPAPTPRAAEEVSYDEAWAALRAGDFAHAAGGFTRVVLLAPDSPLAEDAGFWRAVALARGKRSLEAVAAFHDFLDGHARSPRAGQASAMLGWLLIDARVLDEAERRFRAAAGDPDPAVRRSAQAGLDALAGRTR